MLVIARYTEDISWASNLNVPVTIYDKSKSLTPSNNIIHADNIGRESETYLRYILDNYDTLPDYMIFSQGNPFAHCMSFLDRISNSNYDNVEYLSDWIVTEDLHGRPYAAGYGMVDMLNQLEIPLNVHEFVFPAGAQYIVPKSKIINKSKSWWEACYIKHNSNELSPWIFERIWPIIFEHDAL